MSDGRRRRGATAERALAAVTNAGIARREDAAAVDVCQPALDQLATLRDELNRLGGIDRDWPGGLPGEVSTALQDGATAIGLAHNRVSMADAMVRSAEFGRR